MNVCAALFDSSILRLCLQHCFAVSTVLKVFLQHCLTVSSAMCTVFVTVLLTSLWQESGLYHGLGGGTEARGQWGQHHHI